MLPLFAIVSLPLIVSNMDSDMSEHPIPVSSSIESLQEHEAISKITRGPMARFKSSQISNTEPPHVPASTNTTTAMDLPSQPNESETSHLYPCKRWDKCFQLGCRFRHPANWYVCETGLDCRVYACKGTHPYPRRGACHYGEKCSNNDCQWLHPETRLIESLPTRKYQSRVYNKPFPTDRSSQYPNVAEWCTQLQSHLRLPDSNLGRNGAKHIDQPGQYLHLSHQTTQAQQLTVGKFQKYLKKQTEGREKAM